MYTSWDIGSNSYEHNMNELENIITSDFEDSFLTKEVDNTEKVNNNPDNAPAKQNAPGNKSCLKHIFRKISCFACSLRNL
ncbi:hypothetical protein [Wolbachia endosymbiont of Folsomia candida]|uniref:hypothetical protein n=1 Tax=Wolbachia endosymbiont of Folsomia candida TaxID=169402 RepID=UPI000A7C961B|nr:hypothetical protein [Wolbachia endosymbiont of Folsomia candida]APR98860.1 hypothetical protein ASM33_06590 [Wolbachia endosymbiont of Folsomia candida]